MKSTKSFNNISDKLKKEIPKLKPNEVVTFRMLNGAPNPDPDPQEKERNPVLYGKVQINTNKRVYDKYQKNEAGEEVGGYVDIGVVDRWNGDQPERYRLFVPGMGEYSRFQGKFSLVGGNARDEEMYEFLFLSPERKGSPCADNSIEPLFEIIDLKADVKATTGKYATLKKAIEYVESLKTDENRARAIMASLNQPTYQDSEILLSKVTALATSNPDDFIKTYENAETPIIGIIKEALDRGEITHDISTGEVKVGKIKLLDLKIDSVQDFPKMLAKWIATAENGQDVLANIKSRLEAKAAVK